METTLYNLCVQTRPNLQFGEWYTIQACIKGHSEQNISWAKFQFPFIKQSKPFKELVKHFYFEREIGEQWTKGTHQSTLLNCLITLYFTLKTVNVHYYSGIITAEA